MTLTLVQQSVVRHLSEHPFFSGTAEDGAKGIPVIAGNDKSLASKVETSMARLGLCVIVYPISGDFGNMNILTPYLQPARFNARVRENIVMNRSRSGTGQPADYVAEVCALLLQHHKPLAEDGITELGGGGIVLTGIVADEDEPGINAWNLIFQYSAGVSHEPVRLDFGGSNQTPPP